MRGGVYVQMGGEEPVGVRGVQAGAGAEAVPGAAEAVAVVADGGAGGGDVGGADEPGAGGADVGDDGPEAAPDRAASVLEAEAASGIEGVVGEVQGGGGG